LDETTKRLFPILLVIFTNILGAGVIIPILPLYAEGQYGGTVLQITLLSSSFFGAQFIAAPWLGRLSDLYGRRPVLILSQLGTVLALVLFIFAGPIGGWIDSLEATLPMTGGMIMLYVARILDGLTGGNITTAQAYVSDITTQEDRASGLGLLQAAFGVGFIFGPAFGGVLSKFGPVVPFIGAAIITTGTLLLTTFSLEESLPPEERGDKSQRGSMLPSPELLKKERALVLVLLIGFTAALAFSSLTATYALYANRVLFGPSIDPMRVQLYIGLMLTFNGLIQVITQVALLQRLVKRLGEQRLLLVGESALFAAFAGFASTGSALAATALLAPFAFGQGVSEPSLQSLVTRFGVGQVRGQMLGFYQSARSLALIIGPIWAGYVFEALSPRAVYWGGSLLVFIAILFVLVLLRQDLPSGISQRNLKK
jgi:DHA1 family tetracycline resistance protein-like MFS transporter